MASGYMGWNGAGVGGVVGGGDAYLQQLLAQQKAAQPQASGTSFGGGGAASGGGFSTSSGTPLPPPQPTAPAPTTPAPSGGGGGDYGAYLQQLQQQVNSYDPTAGINDAYAKMRDYVGQQTIGQATGQMGARGLLPSDNTSQDLRAVLMGKAMAPLAAQQADALSNAQQQALNNKMSVAGMMNSYQQQQQQADLQRQQLDYQKQADAANRAFQQQQFDTQQRQWQTQWDASQKAQQDAQQRQQQAQQPYGGGPQYGDGGMSSPQVNDGSASGGAAGAALAKILGGSGGVDPSALLASQGGGGAPGSASGSGMGGGAGLSSYSDSTFGKKFGGFTGGHKWDGVDRSVGYNKPFEGAGTTTVGAALNGPTTTGSGTMVGGGSPFSSIQAGPSNGSGLFSGSGGSTNAAGAGAVTNSLNTLKGALSGGGSSGQVANAPFPGVSGSGGYGTVAPKAPAPAPKYSSGRYA